MRQIACHRGVPEESSARQGQRIRGAFVRAFAVSCLAALMATSIVPQTAAAAVGDYEIEIAPVPGFAGTIGSHVSVNNAGAIALVTTQPSANAEIWLSERPSAATALPPTRPITIGITADQFGAPQINDENQVLTRREETINSGFPITSSHLELWDATQINSRVTLAEGSPVLGPIEFLGIREPCTTNNNDGRVFSVIERSGGNALATIQGAAKLTVGLSSAFPWPMMADNYKFVAKLSNERIAVLPPQFFPFQAVASPSNGFSQVGERPGISDAGDVVVFAGQRATGAGIFLSWFDGASFGTPVLIAGESGNGVLEPGETWSDLDSDGAVDQNEDQGGIESHSIHGRVNVNSTLDELGAVRVAYVATDAVTHREAVFVSRVVIDRTTGQISAELPQRVAVKDQSIPGDPGRTFEHFVLHDGMNDLGEVVFWAETTSGGPVVVRGKPARRPVFIVPGIAGAFPRDRSGPGWRAWLTHRGVPPGTMELDPVANVYADLVRTLENVGYEEGKDLFLVAYDWRLVPASTDGSFDGLITGFTAEDLAHRASQQPVVGVDYLGHYLALAVERWAARFPAEAQAGIDLDAVDVIAHSTGGLVARSYIQSSAYGQPYFSPPLGRDVALPRVNLLVMQGVPNRGASKAWNVLHDNWIENFTYYFFFAGIVSQAFEKVMAENATIVGPPGESISRSEFPPSCGAISSPFCNAETFIRRYVPTIRTLLATYPFLDGQPVNADPAERNDLLLDLNAGADLLPQPGDPTQYVSLVGRVMAQVGVDVDTAVLVRSGPSAALGEGRCTVKDPVTGSVILKPPVFRMADSSSTCATKWFFDETFANAGDGTVPSASSLGFLGGLPNVTVDVIPSAEHTAIPSDATAQRHLLNALGIAGSTRLVSSGLASGTFTTLGNAWWLTLDPVNGVVVDAQGRRLGFDASDGVVQEIPGSIWFGDRDGIGWVPSPLSLPASLELEGLGSRYSARVSGRSSGGPIGAAAEGTLPAGAKLSVPVVTIAPNDADGDLVDDAADNCPFTANTGQQDAGGLGTGSAPDGIGDVCQCGDVSGDGRVTLVDAVLVQRSLLQPPTATLVNTSLCDVNGSTTCSLADAVVIRRSLLSPPAAAIAPECSPARP